MDPIKQLAAGLRKNKDDDDEDERQKNFFSRLRKPRENWFEHFIRPEVLIQGHVLFREIVDDKVINCFPC